LPLCKELTSAMPLPDMAKFTIVYLLVLMGVNIMLAVAAFFSCRIYGDSFKENYSRYGLALLPLTLTGFMAYHVYYLINLGVQLPILISENFHFEIFRQLIITVPPRVTHFVQQALLWIGLFWSLTIMYRLGRSSCDRLFTGLLGLLPHAVLASTLAFCLSSVMGRFFYPI
jgi:hypothetical protein